MRVGVCLAAAKQKAIVDGLHAEQAKEDARVAYANRSKEFGRWATIAQQVWCVGGVHDV
jgi:hypothetical protein